jgi:hypothetical protein
MVAVALATAVMAGDLPVQLIHQEGGETTAIAMSGNRLYLAIGPRLVVQDITDPQNPVHLGQSEVLAGPSSDLAVSGNHVYMLIENAGIQILDVSDPAAPARLGFCPLEGDTRVIAVSGCYAYAYDSGGLRVVDVSDPAKPVKLGHCTVPCSFFRHMAASGDHVYAVDYWTSLYIIDVSDPQVPSISATYMPTSLALAVAVSDQYAFLLSSCVLDVLDVSDPAAPSLVNTQTVFGDDIVLTDRYACVAGTPGGLTLLDIQNPSAPAVTARYKADYAIRVSVDNGYCSVLDWLGGIRIMDLNNLPSPLRVGEWEGPGYAYAIATTQDYVYVAGSGGFWALDISNPVSPTTAGVISGHQGAEDMAVSGNIAARATGGGLSLVDVSNPAAPTVAGYYDTGSYGRTVAMLDAHTCVIDSWEGLLVLDISDLASPTPIGVLSGSPPRDIAISGQFAYLATYGGGGLKIVDLSDPTTPVLAGEWTGAEVARVAVGGSNTCVVANRNQIIILDISNPANPVFMGSMQSDFEPTDLVVKDSRLYLTFAAPFPAKPGPGVDIVDITDPTRPTLIGTYLINDSCTGIGVVGDYAYVISEYEWAQHDLLVLDVSKPGSPWVSEQNLSARGLDVAAAGEYAYWACNYGGLRITDLSPDGGFETVATYHPASPAEGVAVWGEYVILAACAAGIEIIDVSDPLDPIRAGSIDTGGCARKVAVDSHYAYVADYYAGIQIIDIANPASPVRVGGYDTTGTAWAVALSGGYAFVADSTRGLQILDISNPASPAWVGGYDAPGSAMDVAVSGFYAYIANDSNDSGGLLIFDVSDPASPSLVHQYTSSGTVGNVSISGSKAYILTESNGLEILDISNPVQPVPITQSGYGTSYQGHVTTAYPYVLLADYYNGINILHISPRSDFDADGDVDADDLDLFETCASGPGITPASGCEGRDLDGDSDVDQSDLGLLQRCLSGLGTPASMDCDR